MLLKRLYQKDKEGALVDADGRQLTKKTISGGKESITALVDSDGEVREAVVVGVKVKHAGDKQHFSPRIIERGVAEGWMSLERGVITIHSDEGDVVYKIKAPPGYFCCHCLQPLGGEASSRAHLADAHKGAKSPDAENPAGYRKNNYFDCVKEG